MSFFAWWTIPTGGLGIAKHCLPHLAGTFGGKIILNNFSAPKLMVHQSIETPGVFFVWWTVHGLGILLLYKAVDFFIFLLYNQSE